MATFPNLSLESVTEGLLTGDMAEESPAWSSFVFGFGELETLNLNT